MISPKVSVITVCYNSERTIEDTIKSVVRQSYPHVEYIIIDGLSTDGTHNIIDKYREKISLLISEKDEGIYHAINKGIRIASGEIISILNSDDMYMDLNVIRDVVQLFESTRPDAVYADLIYVDKENTDKVLRNWKAGTYREGMFRKGWMPPHPTLFVRKDVYNRFGLFDLQFISAADYEIMLRFIHKHKINIVYLRRTTVKMRMGGMSNISFKNRLRANREDRLAWKINGLKPGLLTLFLKPLSKLIQFF